MCALAGAIAVIAALTLLVIGIHAAAERFIGDAAGDE